MLIQPSSLAQLVFRIGETLEADYGVDPVPVYTALGLDPAGPGEAGARVPNRVVAAMFERALELTGDPAVGIRVGQRSEARHFFVIGYTWLASATLAEAMSKLLRYEAILDSGETALSLEREGGSLVLSERYPKPDDYPGKLRVDNEIASVLKMCRLSTGRDVLPRKLEVYLPADAPTDVYAPLVRGPVQRSKTRTALHFDPADLEAPLAGSIPDVVEATSRIADRYLGTLDDSKVAHQVRAQLVQMLPSGAVDQEKVAARLYRSASTLQRQLSAEGTSYRDVLDDTRCELAQAYLRDGRHSQTETAFLVGFSDQSNFSRAFRRWTGKSPGEYRKAAQASG